MTERWSVGMLGAIGSASGGVSAATASIIGGGERLLAGTVTGVGTGGLIATLLFLASQETSAFNDGSGERPLPEARHAAGSTTAPDWGVTGRFAHHVVPNPDAGPNLKPETGAEQPHHHADGVDPSGSVAPRRAPERHAGELFDMLGALIGEEDRARAEHPERTEHGDRAQAPGQDGDGGAGWGSGETHRPGDAHGSGDANGSGHSQGSGHSHGSGHSQGSSDGSVAGPADWPASLAAILGEALPEPAPEGAREFDRREGANPASDPGPTTTERPPETSRFCPPERRGEPGCSARDRSSGLEHGSRDGYGRNRKRHRPR